MRGKELDMSFDWDVKERPLYDAKGEVIEGYKRLTHSQTGATIHVCKSSYEPVHNTELMHHANRLTDYGFTLEGCASFKDGRKVLAYLKNPKALTVAGVPTQDYLILGNSHDGSSSFFIGASNYMYRCENMFTSTKHQWKLPHRKGVGRKLANITEAYDLYYNEKTGMYEQIENFADVSITQSDKLRCADMVLNREYKADMSTRMKNIYHALGESINRECDALGNNAFGLFNGVTHYTTHNLTSPNVFGNPFGHANTLNQRAYAFCKALFDNRPQLIATNVF